jgi:endonuclease/exonuclease/phosphatase family metal-dependent hydrolase
VSATEIHHKHRTILRRRHAALASVVLAASAGCVASVLDDTAPAASQPAIIPLPIPVPGTTYKVLMYNLQLRPLTTCVTAECDSEIYNMSNETRAGLIASKLLADDPDIIVLNEPFDEGARDVLVEELSSRYPTVVQKLKENLSLREDAGLMLFAKASALAVPTPSGGECFQPGTSGTCLVAFHRYRNRAGADALVQNGIGFVRLHNPATGRPLNVLFTHLQANERNLTLDESRAVRAAQIEEAKVFINQWAPSSALDQDTVLAGDLNVRGAPDGEDDDPVFQEYGDRITGDSGFGGLGLEDTHRLAASPADPMFSFDGELNSAQRGGSRSRLDYILFRPAAIGTGACVQHTTLRRGYHVETAPGDGYIGTDLSDHFPIDATIGRAGASCTPRAPVEVQAADAAFARTFGGDRDAVQWFHQPTAGTYSLSLGGFANVIADSSVDIEVYRDDDLSEPLTPYLGSAHLRAQDGVQPPNRAVFAVDGPFFVRVRAHDSAFSGSYTLLWHRHRGASFDDAIALDPFTTLAQQSQLSNGDPQPLPTVFYSIVQHALDSGARQQLQLTTDGHPTAQLRIQLFNAARAPIAGLSTGYAAAQQTLTVNATSSPISGAQQRLFFTVDRVGCSGTCSSTFNVSWRTNHRRLDLREIEIEDDADGVTDDDDEVVLRVQVDGGAEQSFNLGQVHKASVKRLPATLRDIGFASQVTIRFTETDQGLSGADDVSEPRSINANDLPFNAADRAFTLDLPMHRGSLTGADNGLYHARATRITQIKS